MTDPNKLSVGDAAPAFALLDADERTVSLSAFAGERVVVYFYPAAMTPGCTTQAIDFGAALASFDEAGVRVVGISPDKPTKLATFRDKESIAFPLLSDPDKETLTAYGFVNRYALGISHTLCRTEQVAGLCQFHT